MIHTKIDRQFWHDGFTIDRIAPLDSHGLKVTLLALLQGCISCEPAEQHEFVPATNREMWQRQIVCFGKKLNIARDLEIGRELNCFDRAAKLFGVETPSYEGAFRCGRKIASIRPVRVEDTTEILPDKQLKIIDQVRLKMTDLWIPDSTSL